jgi:hypothetical protein
VRSPLALALAAAVLLLFPAGAAAERRWLAGDLHVHSCYSHDAYCGPGDDEGDPEAFYSYAGTVDNRFTEAALKGLDYLAITDHNDVRSVSDPAFAGHGVLGIPGYESSLADGGGHAQLLGIRRTLGPAKAPTPSAQPELVAQQAATLRAEGGVFQANHPAYRTTAPFTHCSQARPEARNEGRLDWGQGLEFVPDTVELWNPTALVAPAERLLECFLERGERVAATAGSDSHGTTNPTLARPTTWVLADARTPAAVLAGIRAGRTSLSELPPAEGGAPLLLEADADRDGRYEATVGDVVPPAAPMRVRSQSRTATGVVEVRAGGRTAVDGAPLAPGGEVTFTAPRGARWVRAVLSRIRRSAVADPGRAPSGQPFSTCSDDLGLLALTSPLYVRAPTPPVRGGVPATPGGWPAGPGRAPATSARAGRVVVSARRLRPRGARRLRVRVRWRARVRAPRGAPRPRFDVQLRRRGRSQRWRVLARATGRRVRVLAFRRPRAYLLRVRLRRHGAQPGPWRTRGLPAR